jgi:hypothetical protein
MVHLTKTAPPPPLNFFNFVVVTWQPTILEMTHYEKVILKSNKYGICHYKNLVCEHCYSHCSLAWLPSERKVRV